MLLRLGLIVGMLLCSHAYADEEIDLSEELVEHFDRHFIGLKSRAKRTWDHTHCVRNPIDGSCIDKIGDKVKGSAEVTIKELISHSGSASKMIVDSFGWKVLKTDMIMKYRYAGRSKGRKFCYPGKLFCGYAWHSLHPEGEAEIRLRSDIGTGFSIEVRYFVYKNGEDTRANELGEAAALNLKNEVVGIAKHFVAVHGIPVEVKLVDKSSEAI